MPVKELSWSAFLREPTKVEPLLERGEVILRRRDGEPLRLSKEAGGAAQRQAVQAAVRLLVPAGELRVDHRMVAERLPWTRFLTEADRRTLAAELLKTLEACADLGDFTALGRLVEEWKTTAALHAEGTDRGLKKATAKNGRKVRRS
jgi:hypothetical protein